MVTLVNVIYPAYTTPGLDGAVQKATVANVFGWFGITNGVSFFFSAHTDK